MSALKAALPNAPDLLIADAGMPPCSGIDLAMLFQQRLPNCKVLLFSGQWHCELLLQAAGSGLEFETIPKPVDPKELIKRVEKMTAATSRCIAKNLALKTYSDNAHDILSRLQADISKRKTGHAK